MPITNVAKITSWNEAKGFGFAEVNRKKYLVILFFNSLMCYTFIIRRVRSERFYVM